MLTRFVRAPVQAALALWLTTSLAPWSTRNFFGPSLSLVSAAPAGVVRGVAPQDNRYANANFACSVRPGSPPPVLNDDFCDCPDGSDEPGTGACAGLIGHLPDSPGFYCVNEGYVPRYIYHSRVGDGICDCCDGSDEWQGDSAGPCGDTCKEKQVEMQRQLELKKASMKRGIEKRQEALERASKELDDWRVEVVQLKQNMPALEQEVARRDVLLKEAEELLAKVGGSSVAAIEADKEAQEQVAKKDSGISEYAKWMETGSEQATKASDGVSEYAKWMETGGEGGEAAPAVATGQVESVAEAGTATTVTSEPAVEVPRRELREIRVRSGALVDFIDFVYESGEPLVTGAGQGNPQEPFVLNPGEALVEIRGGQGGLLDAVQFVTNQGRESKRYGGNGGTPFSMKAQQGQMIVGVNRMAGTAGKISGLHVCQLTDRRSPEEKARDAARVHRNEAQHRVEDAKARLQAMEENLASDAKSERGAYQVFADKCAENRLDKYNYRICLFGDAKQDGTKLGSWSRWDPQQPHRAHFENGQRCYSGHTRSLQVSFECGESIAVLSVREPSQCTYEASMSHPAACDPSAFEAPGGQGRVVQAHEEL